MRKISLILLIAFIFISSAQSKECKMLTSPPNYSTMKPVVAEGYYMTTPTIQPKTFKYTSFMDAYKLFYSSLQTEIHKKCKKYKKLKGVVNLKIQHSVSKNWYNFIATYDVYE